MASLSSRRRLILTRFAIWSSQTCTFSAHLVLLASHMYLHHAHMLPLSDPSLSPVFKRAKRVIWENHDHSFPVFFHSSSSSLRGESPVHFLSFLSNPNQEMAHCRTRKNKRNVEKIWLKGAIGFGLLTLPPVAYFLPSFLSSHFIRSSVSHVH